MHRILLSVRDKYIEHRHTNELGRSTCRKHYNSAQKVGFVMILLGFRRCTQSIVMHTTQCCKQVATERETSLWIASNDFIFSPRIVTMLQQKHRELILNLLYRSTTVDNKPVIPTDEEVKDMHTFMNMWFDIQELEYDESNWPTEGSTARKLLFFYRYLKLKSYKIH